MKLKMKRIGPIGIVVILLLIVYTVPTNAGSIRTVDSALVEKADKLIADRTALLDGRTLQRYPDGALARETWYRGGTKDGPYLLWYANGVRQLACSYRNNLLHGPCHAWFENGKLRVGLYFHHGKRTGEWIRMGEKVGEVARISFREDQLNGPLIVKVNRGYGSGRGTSFEMQAQFSSGLPIAEFSVTDTDDLGHSIILAGEILPGEQVIIDRQKNVTWFPDGGLVTKNSYKETRYADIESFLLAQVAVRVMPMFTLDFCSIKIHLMP